MLDFLFCFQYAECSARGIKYYFVFFFTFIFFKYINYINSISPKFDDLKFLNSGIFDILIITETKLDETYPISQFHIDGYSMPYRLDRNRNGGGVIIYVREDIPSKILRKHFFPNDIEEIFVEISFRKSKWLLCGTYHPPLQSDQHYFDNIDKVLDVYCQYEKIMLVGDFNAQIEKKMF